MPLGGRAAYSPMYGKRVLPVPLGGRAAYSPMYGGQPLTASPNWHCDSETAVLAPARMQVYSKRC